MQKLFRSAAASLVLSTAAVIQLPASAQALDTYCETNATKADLAKSLDGFWQVKNGVGTLQMMGQVMPLPTGQISDGAIETAADGSMTITSSEQPGSFPLAFHEGQSWNFALQPDTPLDAKDVLENLDIAVLVGCDPNILPRVHATGSFAEESGTVDFDLYLFVISEDLMYGATKGVMKGPQGEGTATRLITFSR